MTIMHALNSPSTTTLGQTSHQQGLVRSTTVKTGPVQFPELAVMMGSAVTRVTESEPFLLTYLPLSRTKQMSRFDLLSTPTLVSLTTVASLMSKRDSPLMVSE